MGRPRLPEGKAKGLLIGARFSPPEAKIVADAVRRAKAVKSQWVRMCLLSPQPLASFFYSLGQSFHEILHSHEYANRFRVIVSSASVHYVVPPNVFTRVLHSL